MSPSLLPHSGLYWPITSLHSPNPLFQRLLTSSALASLTNLASFLLPNPIFWHLLVITFYDSTLYTFCLSSSCYFTLSSHFFLFALTLPLLPSNHLNIFFFVNMDFLKSFSHLRLLCLYLRCVSYSLLASLPASTFALKNLLDVLQPDWQKHFCVYMCIFSNLEEELQKSLIIISK